MLDVKEISRSDRDLAALTVLAVLTAAPRRPDEIHQLLIDTDKSFVADLPHSLHVAVADLENDGFVERTTKSEPDSGPGQIQYALTDKGQSEVQRRVEQLLTVPTACGTTTYAAISFISLLPQDRAVAAIRSRSAALKTRIAELEAHLIDAEADLLMEIESDFELERLTAEERWMSYIANRLDIGALQWS